LAQITPETGVNSQPTHALATVAAPGATAFAGAPALPNAALLNPANYPTLDKTPPTNSPEVLGWIQEVQNSGITIPTFSATNIGGCPNNSAAIADNTERCWWTCGGCVRSTDITTCPDKLTWGITYDDGPSPYTPDLLNYLGQQGLKATFFVVGSRAISYPPILQSAYIQQHQIAVHTWSHPYMSTLTNEQIIAELGWSKKIIKDVTGVTPLYWRPPYGDIDDRVRAIATAMQLTPVMWTDTPQLIFDTEDFGIKGGLSTPGGVLENWLHIVGNASTLSTGFIVLEHDLFEQSVDMAVGYILPDALATTPKLTIKPVITCNKQPMSNAYIETNNNATNPIATVAPAAVSTTLNGASPTATGKSGSVGRMDTLPAAFIVALGLASAALFMQ
jgi:peptidoglycan/xylan/chitin deacetylase (PgdA/CDA1 family)